MASETRTLNFTLAVVWKELGSCLPACGPVWLSED